MPCEVSTGIGIGVLGPSLGLGRLQVNTVDSEDYPKIDLIGTQSITSETITNEKIQLLKQYLLNYTSSLLSLFSVEQIVVCAFRMLDCLVHLMVQSCCKPSSCEYTAYIIMLKSFLKKLYNGYGRLKISLLYRCMRYCSCEF